MVKMKRKLAAGGEDKRANEASGASPVNLAEIGCIPPPGASPLLDSTVAEMEAAATYYLQLSVLQRLKAELLANVHSRQPSAAPDTISSAADVAATSTAELGLVLDWLLALYLHPASRPLRKTLTAVVAAAEVRSKSTLGGAAADPGLASARATAALSSYCSRLSLQASSDADTRVSWSVGSTSAEVATLLAVLELPLLSTSLFEVSDGAVEGLLTCLAAHLSHHLQAVLAAAPSGSAPAAAAAISPTSVKRDRDGNAIASVHAAEALASVECCGFVLTGVIALISAREGKAWSPSGLLDTTTKDKAAAAQHQDAWRQLMDGCLALLERCGVVPKDQLTQAALALVLLSKPLWAISAEHRTSSSSMEQDDTSLELSARAEAIARTFAGLFEDKDDSSEGQQGAAPAKAAARGTWPLSSSAQGTTTSPLGAMVVASLHARCAHGMLPPLARLALLRGIAHGIDLAVLLQPSPLAAHNGKGGSGLLCGSLFRAVAEKCSDANTLVQVYAFQVLEALLGRLATALSQASSTPPHDHREAGEQLRDLLPEASVIAALVKDTLELTLRFWEQPAKPLARVLPTVFTRVVELSAFTTNTTSTSSKGHNNSERGGGGSEAAASAIPWWSPLLRRLRDQPPTRKGKYAALAVLVPHIVKASVISASHTNNTKTSSNSDAAMSKTLRAHAQALTASRVVRNLLVELLPSTIVAATALKAGEANATAGAAQLLSLLLHSLKQHHREARVALPGGSANGGNASGASSRRGRGGKNPRSTATSSKANTPHDSLLSSGDGDDGGDNACKEAETSALKEAALAVDVAEASGRGIWAEQLCHLLLLSPQAMAARGVEHLLGEALTADPDAAPTLLAEIARLSLGTSSGISSERLLWARVHVVRLARLNGARNAHGLISHDNDDADASSNSAKEAEEGEAKGSNGLSLSALAISMMHFSSDLRLSALEVVAAATKTKSFPPQHELNAFMNALPYSLNCGGADQRHRVMRLVQRLVVRARDTGRGLELSGSSLDGEKEVKAAAGGGGGGGALEKGGGEEDDDVRTRINEFVRWLIGTLLKQLYPGAPFSRELLALELLHLIATEVLDNAGWSEAHTKTLPKQANASKQDASTNKKKQQQASTSDLGSSPSAVVGKWSVAKVLQEELWDSSAACRTLLPLLLSSWDRSRSLTKQLLTRFALPLPGVNLLPRGTPSSSSSLASSLLGDALTLCGSPRQTEADAGALALHLVFQTAVLGSGQRLHLLGLNPSGGASQSSTTDQQASSSSLSCAMDVIEEGASLKAEGRRPVEGAAYLFLHDLCALSEQRLGALVPIFASVHAGVSHGSHAPAVGDFKGRAIENQQSVLAPIHADDEDKDASMSPSPSPAVTLELVNGLLVALKLCVASSAPLVAKLMNEAQALEQKATSAAAGQKKEEAEAAAAEVAAVVTKWCALLERCVAAAVRALQVAMVVVADAGFDSNDNDDNITGGVEGEDGACLQSFTNPAAKARQNSKGKASSSESNGPSSAMAVNAANAAQGISSSTNNSNSETASISNSYGEDAGAAARGGGKEAKGDAAFMLFQAAVVGGWQMAREACGCLAALVQAMPLPTQEDDTDSYGKDEDDGGGARSGITGVRLPSSVLKVATVRAVGDALLDALQRLRHTGAIVAAQAGFQSLCRSLLAPTSARGAPSGARGSGAARALRALPSEWARSVVLRLEASGGDGLYVLRRSASFGYSFLSIARADPGLGSSGSNRDSSSYTSASSTGGTAEGGSNSIGNSSGGGGTVLPFILEKLLGCAEATTSTSHSSEYRVGVHALNVLRLLFADAQVGESVSIEVPRGLRCAVRGFKHEQWAVRNSAMMLFTALVQRAIANAKNHAASGSGAEAALKRANVPLLPPSSMKTTAASRASTLTSSSNAAENSNISTMNTTSAHGDASSGGGGDRGSTAAGFFHRFPSLAPFMLSELEDATSSTRGGDSHHQTLHPSLVPLLLLLSRLRPSVESAETNSLVLIAPSTSSGSSSSHSGSAFTSSKQQLEAVPLPVFLSQLLHLVLQCRSQRFHAARTMAARAAAVLCPVDLAAALATNLCDSLPGGGGSDQGPGEEKEGHSYPSSAAHAATKVEECPKSVNAMHGTLLLVKELVATGFTHLASQQSGTSAGHSLSSSTVSAAAASMDDDDDDENTTAGESTAAASETASNTTTMALLSALSSRVAPLLTHPNCPPPLRLLALEVLQVAGAFQHSFPPLGTSNPNVVQEWATQVLHHCLATAASDLLLHLPPPPPPSNAMTATTITTTAQGVPLESVAAPWLSLLRAALARSAALACFQTPQLDHHSHQDEEGMKKEEDVLPLLLLSNDHDVRCAAIKGVKKVLRHLPSSLSTSTSSSSPLVLWGRGVTPLDALLFEALRREDYPPSQCRLLTCLALLRTAAAASAARNGTETTGRIAIRQDWSAQWSLLAKLFAGHAGSSNSDVPARSLALMGSLLHEQSSTSNDDVGTGSNAHHYSTWLALLKVASQPHLKPCMRLAAVQSILASNCLAMPLNSNRTLVGSGTVLGAWFVCFTLALDDDEEVRDAAAQALTSHGNTQSLQLDTRPCNARALEVAMDGLTKKVLVAAAHDDQVNDLVGDYAGHLEAFWRSAAATSSLLAPLGGDGSGEDVDTSSSSSRAIFEVEEDNLYSEPVLVAQLAARQLALLFSASNMQYSGVSPPSSANKLATVAHTLEQSLEDALQSMLRDARASSGAGATGAGEGSNASLLDGRAIGFQAQYAALAALGCGPALVRSSKAQALAAELQALPSFKDPSVLHPVLRAAIDASFPTPSSIPNSQEPSAYYFLAAPPVDCPVASKL